MSEKGANIDLLFRNGLKDYEVLPPAGVWEGVNASGKLKTKSYILPKIAAAALLLFALSYFTYRLSREVNSSTGTLMAFDVNKEAPVRINSEIRNYPAQSLPAIAENNLKSIEETPAIAIDSGNNPVIIVSPVSSFHYSAGIASLSLPERRSSGNSFHAPSFIPESNANTSFAGLNYPQTQIIEKAQNRWSVAALASPTYYSKFSSAGNDFSKKLGESEEPLMSYTGGLGLAYKISKRFSIQSGIYYSSLGQKVDGINSFEGFKPYDNSKGASNFVVHTTSGEIYASNPDIFLSANASERIATEYTNDVFDPRKANLQYLNNSLTQNLGYLELPLILRYKLVDKTLGINLIGGVSYNLLVNNSVYTTIEGSKYIIGDTKGLNPLSVSSSFGMGMEYNFSRKLSLNLEPTFRYYLNPFNTQGSFVHPYSFGIFSGVSYKF